MAYFSICTPTYNRAHLLHRPFKSLCNQTFKDFEWIIIDDGSTDDTKEVVNILKKEADFPIYYVKTENRGRAAALNESYKYINAKYVMNLDSDDEFVEDCLERIYKIWESIPPEEYNRFWCVTGHCIDNIQRKQIGIDWPANINDLHGRKQHKVITKYKQYSEKSCCRKIDVLKKYPFPQYLETKFVPEDIVWEKVNKEYDQYCVNEVFRVYFVDSEDSLAKANNMDISRRYSSYYLALFFVNECLSQILYNRNIKYAILQVARASHILGKKYNEVVKSINSITGRMLVSLAWPLMFIYCKINGEV